MKTSEPSFIKILKWFGVFLVVFFTFGIGIIFYQDYKNERVPIYQSTVTDFRLLIPKTEYTETHPEQQQELQKFVDSFKIRTLQCYIFQAHSQRPNYFIYFIGRISPNEDFSKYSKKQYSLKENIRNFSALKLCGAEPEENDDYIELTEPINFNYYSVYIYKNVIIFSLLTNNQTFLSNDVQKQAFLSKFLINRNFLKK